jgi:hypothetical protein
MSELWYYAEGVETRGPFSLADLVGNLSKASDPEKVLVWRKGFENWKPVSAVSEVAGQMIRPPPLRPTPPRVVSPAEPPSKIYEPVVSGDLGALKDVKPPLSGRRSNSTKFSRRKKKRRRPLYDLAMRRGLSSDCCSSALWALRASRALGSHPRALSLVTWQNYARFRQFFSALVYGTFLFGRGSVLIPKPLS